MFQKQSFSTTFRKAKELDKNKHAASRIRMRYLNEQVDILLQDGSDIALYWACEALEEVCYLAEKGRYEVQQSKDHITDEMIQRAKEFPVEQLITFVSGKAYAFCHDDKRPSMTKHKQKNVAYCWACSKGYDPISILMERDGLSFKDSVKELN